MLIIYLNIELLKKTVQLSEFIILKPNVNLVFLVCCCLPVYPAMTGMLSHDSPWSSPPLTILLLLALYFDMHKKLHRGWWMFVLECLIELCIVAHPWHPSRSRSSGKMVTASGFYAFLS